MKSYTIKIKDMEDELLLEKNNIKFYTKTEHNMLIVYVNCEYDFNSYINASLLCYTRIVDIHNWINSSYINHIIKSHSIDKPFHVINYDAFVYSDLEKVVCGIYINPKLLFALKMWGSSSFYNMVCDNYINN